MKRSHLLLALIVLLLAGRSAPGWAQYSNTIGIYTTAGAGSSEIYSPALGSPFKIYFVLADPRTETGTAITAIQGFEFRVRVTGGANTLYRTHETLPSGALNIADISNYAFDSTYIVGLRTPLPVTNRLVTLVIWDCLVMGGLPYYFYLEPVVPASIPGQLAFDYPVGDGFALMGATGTQALYTMPEFALGAHIQPPVATESATFGTVKALYR